MRFLLLSFGLLCLFPFFDRPVQAQQTLKGYLEACKPQECDNIQNLTCAGQGDAAFCAITCDVLTPLCPKNEPCTIQANGQGACVCLKDEDCKEPQKCVDGQCAGGVGWGVQCFEKAPCARGMLCLQSTQEKQTYCRPMCRTVGSTCSAGEPCTNLPGSTFPVCYCASNAECKDGKNCIGGRCLPPPSYGGQCDDTILCRKGLTCTKIPDLTNRYCLAPCPSGGCAGGERCFDASNRQRICACTKSDPCPAGIPCVNGACLDAERCDPETPCKTGEYCLSTVLGAYGGICRPRCTTSADCQSSDAPCKNFQGLLLCACAKDQDCPSGQVCSQHRCIKSSSSETPSEPTKPNELTERTEDSTDAGESVVEKIATEGNPSACNPACSGKQRCRNGVCEKLELREFCELDTDCKSNFCFSADKRAKICSTKDCNQCGLLGLQCIQGNGSEGCYSPPYINPVPDTGSTAGCNCNQHEPAGWSLLGLFFLVLLFHRRLAPQNRKTT